MVSRNSNPRTSNSPFRCDWRLHDSDGSLGHLDHPLCNTTEQAAVLAGAMLRSDDREADVDVGHVPEDLLMWSSMSNNRRRLDAVLCGCLRHVFDRFTTRLF
jgi:hypothetical protein